MKPGDVIRGRPFVYRGGLSGIYYFARARKIERIHDDGRVTFSVIGRRDDVSESVRELIAEESRRPCPCCGHVSFETATTEHEHVGEGEA